MQYLDLYTRLDEIESKLGFRKRIHNNQIFYEGVFVSGDFSQTLYDYGSGFLFATVSWTIGKENRMYVPFVAITTVDDETWRAFGNVDMPLELVKQETENIVRGWIWNIILPTEKELNEYLDKYGMKGKYDE